MEGSTVPNLEHAAISVADLDGAVAWYREWFGAVEVKRAARPELGIRAAVVRMGEGLLEIIEPASPSPAPAPGVWHETFFGRQGIHHLALSVDDAAGTMARMKAARVEVLTPLVEGRLFFCRDPFGTLLEVKRKA
jgi:catechol 2,3-dioxygenase-like lactoylglutathione lyase family enzyme